MLENQLTDAYLGCLRELSPALVERGVQHGLGVLGAAHDAAWMLRGRTEFVGFGPGGSGDVPTVLVGLSAQPGIHWPTERRRAGSEVDGVIAVPGKLVVLLEVKPAGVRLDGDQLERHAVSWGLPLDVLQDWQFGTTPPSGFGFALWSHVSRWISAELDDGLATTDERVALRRLEQTLREAGVSAGHFPAFPEPANATAVRPRQLPPATPLEEILAGWPLDEVRATCTRLWGEAAEGDQVVAGTQAACVQDSARVIADYRRAGLEAPSGLFSDPQQSSPGPVMTPRRLLTAAYSGSPQGPSMLGGKKAGEHGAREVALRLRPRGVDRDVCLALLAWALHDERPGAMRAREHLARAWAALEPVTPAVPELTSALDPLRP